MQRDRVNVYSVPPGLAFLDCVAAALLKGDLPVGGGKAPSALDLADITLMLPTRRATRAVADAFLKAAGGRAMLLPQIRPISEGQEGLSLLAGLAGFEPGEKGAVDIPPAMSELERRLTLTTLVMRWSAAMRGTASGDVRAFAAAGAATPTQAATLATELAALMDMVETEEIGFERLADLVPENFSEHWQHTLAFLTIVTETWPVLLAASGRLSPAGRRNAVIRAEARRLLAMPPRGPVIVAGVTGSIPATVELMRAVASLPQGAIVLPGLDLVLDDASWAAIDDHPEHPQFGLRKLLGALGVERGEVAILGGSKIASRASQRERLVAETLRPSGTTARWLHYARFLRENGGREALGGVSLIEAPTAQDEAEAIALILREAAETPGKTAALVSPDRLLARRVAIRLEAWGIKVDDSAGRPFVKTPPGAFLDLIIEVATHRFAPCDVVALLKHPLTRLGLDPFAVRRAGRALEIAVFRRPYLGEGLDGIAAALERATADAAPGSGKRLHSAARRLWAEDWEGASDLLLRFTRAFEPLVAMQDKTRATLSELAAAHTQTAALLAELPAVEGQEADATPLWQNEAGETAQTFFTALLDSSLPVIELVPRDYADFYRSLIRGETVRPRGLTHPRLFIWGPFEARLQRPDVVVLGSLNEGTWPKPADPGAWLNRPMRRALGLPSPEEKIGQSAHDFATLLGAPEVILTRAEKTDGVPTVPSRWLLRLKALLGEREAAEALRPRMPWLGWARRRDRPERTPRLKAPEPRPPVAMRPRKLSISRVERWIANPYAIFAGEILKLEPLDPLGKEPGPALRGNIIHEALARFSRDYPSELPSDICGELKRHARTVLDEYAVHPRIAAFWIPRFERFAEWFAATEPARRAGGVTVVAETSGTLVLEAPAGPFRLTARADRIDIAAAGLVVTDYKTGQVPKDARVNEHLAPQLPLEAAIALSADGGGFPHVPRLPVAALRYIRATGAEPPGEQFDVACEDIPALAAGAREGLGRHVALFDDPTTPYKSLRRARFDYAYDDFAHLARVAEWAGAAVDGGEGQA